MDLFQWMKNAYSASRHVVRIPDGPPTPLVRRRYRFSGRVQGVGFRYEAKLLAGQLNLTGWAQNKSDGTVVVEIEGEESCVGEFLRAIRETPRFDITAIEAENLALSREEGTFKVVY